MLTPFQTPDTESAGDPQPDELPVDFESALSTVTDSLLSMWEGLLSSLPQLLIGLLVLLATWALTGLVGRILSRVLKRTRLRASLKDLFLQLSNAGLWVAGLLVAATVVFPGVTPGKLLTVLGLGSIAIGFAFKDIFENFFAGILILWRFPIEKGDVITLGDITGHVEDVTIRMTQIRRLDDQLVVLPNGRLFKEAVLIKTNRPQRRVTVLVGVAYDEDVEQARQVIRAAVEDCERVAADKPVQLFVRELNSSSVDFELSWWCDSSPLAERQAKDEVISKVKRALDEAGIEIPFPHRTLTFKHPLTTRATVETTGRDEHGGADD